MTFPRSRRIHEPSACPSTREPRRGVLDGFLDRVCDRARLNLRPSGDDRERVGEDRAFAHVDRREVFALFFERGLADDVDEFAASEPPRMRAQRRGQPPRSAERRRALYGRSVRSRPRAFGASLRRDCGRRVPSSSARSGYSRPGSSASARYTACRAASCPHRQRVLCDRRKHRGVLDAEALARDLGAELGVKHDGISRSNSPTSKPRASIPRSGVPPNTASRDRAACRPAGLVARRCVTLREQLRATRDPYAVRVSPVLVKCARSRRARAVKVSVRATRGAPAGGCDRGRCGGCRPTSRARSLRCRCNTRDAT